ncbi:MAG: lipid-A-disaccharide synthase [Lacipirellulaceae bacterium]
MTDATTGGARMQVFFSVGEPSGDLHGANLVRRLREQTGGIVDCVGYGGPRMAAEGARLDEDLTQHAVMGFLKVVNKVPKFLALSRRAAKLLRERRPDAVVLIDFPGFNWHVARHAKRLGIPVFYYGTPQLWAWAPWRVRKMRARVDHALCKLPFEEAWLRERGVNATHVGHPYFDEVQARWLDEAFVVSQRAPAGGLVTLLPGSRTQEVKGNFRSQLEAARKVAERVPGTRFAVAAFKESQAELCRREIDRAGLVGASRPEVFVGRTPELIEAATCCLAVSGSVSLELLHHAKPTAILYRVSPVAFWLQGFFRRVRYITLVNLLTAPELFPNPLGQYTPGDPQDDHVLMPEYLTSGDPSDALAGHAIDWLTKPEQRAALESRMRSLVTKVGGGGASFRAAEYILRELGAADPAASAA